MFEARRATFGQAEISLEELLRVKTLMATVPSRLQAPFARLASQFVSSTSGDSVWRTHREARLRTAVLNRYREQPAS
jgi:hypothetical protein